MASAPSIRVLIVDDEPLFRRAMRSMLGSYSDIEIIAEASDGYEAIEHVKQLQPTVVLMDIHLNRSIDGIAATRLIKDRHPDVAILGLSVDTRDYIVAAMEQAGAFEVLNKELSGQDVYQAIQWAAASMSDE